MSERAFNEHEVESADILKESWPRLALISGIAISESFEHPMDFNDLAGSDQIAFGD